MNKGCDKNKYLFVKLTESCRWMRGARETDREYIFELCTERFSSRLQRSSARYKRRSFQALSTMVCRNFGSSLATSRGKSCEWFTNKGGITRILILVLSRDEDFLLFFVLSLFRGYIRCFLSEIPQNHYKN